MIPNNGSAIHKMTYIHLLHQPSTNSTPEPLCSVTKEQDLLYLDETLNQTCLKFSLITVASPLISLVHIVRSLVFFWKGQNVRASKECIGALTHPLLCMGALSVLSSSYIYEKIYSRPSFSFIRVRRVYAKVEAWINEIDLHKKPLPSFSKRVSHPYNIFGSYVVPYQNIWTTAQCMQPILENGYSTTGGLRDVKRIQKIFPGLRIKNIVEEERLFIIHSS